MATTKKNPTPTPVPPTPVEPPVEPPTEPNTGDESRLIDEQTHDRTSVAYLKAEQKRIAEELKAARDAERAKKSGRVSSDVASVNATKALVARVEKRIKSGTEREEALTAELTLLRRAISALLDAQQTQTTEAK